MTLDNTSKNMPVFTFKKKNTISKKKITFTWYFLLNLFKENNNQINRKENKCPHSAVCGYR